MAALIGFILGALIGAVNARRRGGNLSDILQYGAVYGLILGMLSLIGSVIAFNAGWL